MSIASDTHTRPAYLRLPMTFDPHSIAEPTLLGTSHGSPAGSFYAHMARGASPQLLLADLKSQLDLLAVKLGQKDW